MNSTTDPSQDQRPDLLEQARKEALPRSLNAFFSKLSTISSRAELLDYVAREITGRFGFDGCAIYQLDKDRDLLRQVAASDDAGRRTVSAADGRQIPLGQSVAARVAKSAEPIIVMNGAAGERGISEGEPALSELCVPLVADGRVLGVIDCLDPRPNRFGQADLDLVTAVAVMTGLKLQNIAEAERAEADGDELCRLEEKLGAEVALREGAEAALQQHKALVEALIEHSPIAVTIKDLDGRYSFVSPAYCRFLGVGPEEILGKTFAELYPAETAKAVEAADKTILESGEALAGDDALPVEFGSTTHLVTKFPVRGADDAIVGIGTVGIDITERRRTEEKLRESEERLRQASRLAKVGYYVWDAVADRCLFCSDEYARVHGLSSEEYIARASTLEGPFSLTHPEDRERVRAAMLDLRSGKPFDMEYRTVTPEGEVLYLRELAEPVFDGAGRVVQEIGTTQDITEVKLAEQRLIQAQKMEAVGQLTGGVAHDFNNLLAVIQGNAELLALGLPENNTHAAAILRSAARGAELTQRLLAFSRRQTLRPQAIDMADLIDGLWELMARTLGEAIEIKIRSAADLRPALADPGQVENALLNLAINARDAMPRGGKLTIECGNISLDELAASQNPEAKAGDYVVLAVSDTGEGMPADVRARAFEPFFTTKMVGQGSGLGLSMVFGFAKQSGGHVSLYSEVGLGTTVKLFLPQSDGPRPVAEVPAPKGDIPRGRGENVLLVEDDPDVRALAARMIEGLGYRVIGVSCAADAWGVLKAEERIDLLLSDVVLPGGTSGPTFARAAMAHNPDLPVLFMSGYPAEAGKDNTFLGSGTVLLNKPFEMRQLAQALRNALD